jgi:hypothetical protein
MNPLPLSLLAAALASAAASGAPLDAPPPLPAEEKAAPADKRPRTVIRLPESERPAPPAAEIPPLTEPPDDELLPPARNTSPEARIEQRRQGNRIVEIVVTPAGSTASYVIVNREGRPPLSNQELSSGLSLPRFLRFNF